MYPPAILRLKLKINQLSTKLPNVDLEKFSADYMVEHAAQLWPAEDRTALDLLDDFIEDKMAHYKTDRDLPAVDGTSRLSLI